MTEPKPAAHVIQRIGGLAAASDLARRWGISRSRVGQLIAEPDFPKPVIHVGGLAVYAVREADAWRDKRKPATREQA